MTQYNELRIGNWVMHAGSGKPYKVTLERFWQHYVTADAFYYLEPIPLTAKILEACGFKRDGNGFALNGKMSLSFAVTKSDEYLACWLDKSLGVIVNHLHQLQNLYFALAGQELMINETDLNRSVASKDARLTNDD